MQLRALLTTIPRRNGLIVTGDFNCQLSPKVGQCGPAAFRWQGQMQTGTKHGDSAEFDQLIHDFALISNTTWDASQGPTFHHGSHASRIDHIFCSANLHDAVSKHSVFISNAPFLPADGPVHVPILCSFKRVSLPFQQKSHAVTYQQKLKGREAWYQCTADWTAFEQDVTRAIADLNNQCDTCPIDLLHHRTIEAYHVHFTPQPVQRELTVHVGMVKAKWHHRLQMKQKQSAGLRPANQLQDIFRRWMHAARHAKLTKMHNKWVGLRKRQLVQQVIDDADRAANQYDSFNLFRAVNRLTPKSRKRRVRLRTSDGHLVLPLQKRCRSLAVL